MTSSEAQKESQDMSWEALGISTIRGLAMDGPQEANSGHPGTAMALAPLAHVLWTRVMKYDASDPTWPDRDRFVLSCGHASILLYTMLTLTGYGLSVEDLKQFRKWGSLTPGHPEVGHTVGVEVTTGPLGQGIGNSVGLAMAQRWLQAKFGKDLVDHHTWAICSDGDFMEGISHEAASLAGHLELGNLTVIYDNNHITIDGPTELAYNDNVAMRFESYGWNVTDIGDNAENLDIIESALIKTKESSKPSLVIIRSHIGYPSPRFTDTSAAHGDPFGADEIKITKEILGLDPDKTFQIPQEVDKKYKTAGASGSKQRLEWQARLDASPKKSEFAKALNSTLEANWHEALPSFDPGGKVATRKALQACVEASTEAVSYLLSGAGDLTGNTGVKLKDQDLMSSKDHGGRQIAYGIREHAMGAALNGMALHGGILPLSGTFFVFSDYMRPSIRLAALSKAHVIYSFTHDSIGLGQDGPTHQPIEHLASLRAMPGLSLIRPGDANETVHAWRIAVENKRPTAIIGTRQNLDVLEGTKDSYSGVSRGAYQLIKTDDPAVILVASGSEVPLCVKASKILEAEGVKTTVVSMPSWDLFEAQDESYKSEVLPREVPKLGVEAGSSFGWQKYVDEIFAIDRFGASADEATNFEKFGFTPDHIAQLAKELINKKNLTKETT